MRAGNITEVEADWRWSPVDEGEIVSSICTHIHVYMYPDVKASILLITGCAHVYALSHMTLISPISSTFRDANAGSNTPYLQGCFLQHIYYSTIISHYILHYSITHTALRFLFFSSVFIFLIFSPTVMDTQHTHMTTLHRGKAAFSIDLCLSRM